MKAYQVILLAYGTFVLIELIALIRHLVGYLPPARRIRVTLRINIIVLVTGVLMLAAALLFDINYISYESPIPHSQWKEISMKDFRGLKRPSQTLDGDKEFAFIVTNIEVHKTDESLNIVAYFHPARSYVYDRSLAGDGLLTHELYHFHIAEYCARLLRKQVSESGLLQEDQLESMITLIKAREDSLQFDYDNDSYHGYVMAEQLKWERRTDSCLNSLNQYISTSVKLKR